MPVIIISSDFHDPGAEIAQKTAQTLGYGFVGTNILAEAADQYGVTVEKLQNALGDTAGFWGLSMKQRKRCLAYIEAATLARLVPDNQVCYGLGAHLYLFGVSHVLKIQVRGGSPSLDAGTAKEAQSREKRKDDLKKKGKSRQRWWLKIFSIDEADPALYDIAINLYQIEPDEAVKTIVETTRFRKFQAMSYSLQCMADRELASRAKAALVERFPDAKIETHHSAITVEISALKNEENKKASEIKAILERVQGVAGVEVHFINDIFRRAAESFR